MTIEINPDQERRIRELVRSGRFHSVGDLLDQALETFATHEAPMADAEETRRRRAQTAAARIRDLRKGLSLGGLKIKDLIEEGRM
jgi:Arc/MetJ-type ribon-helix-helix transcriptional regulator